TRAATISSPSTTTEQRGPVATRAVAALSCCGIELDHEPCAGVGVLDPDAAAERFDLAAYDREAEARAAAIATATAVDAIEPLEDPVLLALGDAGTGVAHAQPHALVGAIGAHDHRRAAAVLHRVVDQILHDVIETVARAE